MTAMTIPKDTGWMGDPKRGASLGRRNRVNGTPAGKITLQRVRINSGGYDSGGSYWGLGSPLYWACDESGSVDLWFRAASRDAAKAHVRGLVPNARFYR